MKIRGLLALFLVIALASGVRAEDRKAEIKVVTAEGKVYLGHNITMPQAELMALNQARRNALEQAVGIHIRSSSSMFNGELVNELINIAAKGLIVTEPALEKDCDKDKADGRLYCFARLTAHVKPLPERISTLKIREVAVQRADKKSIAQSPIFQDYDEVQVRVISNEPSFLNIFSVDQYGNVAKMYPNKYVKATPVPGRKEFIFPDDSLRARGLRLRVATPEKLDAALESIIVVATDKEAYLLENGLQAPTITDLMREISELDPIEWAANAIGYEVRK